MTGGILQLIFNDGYQDKWLSQNPQITFFKKIYRRHTSFASEVISVPVKKIDFGQNVIIPIPRLGDLAHRMFISIDLPSLEAYYPRTIEEDVSLLIKNSQLDPSFAAQLGELDMPNLVETIERTIAAAPSEIFSILEEKYTGYYLHSRDLINLLTYPYLFGKFFISPDVFYLYALERKQIIEQVKNLTTQPLFWGNPYGVFEAVPEPPLSPTPYGDAYYRILNSYQIAINLVQHLIRSTPLVSVKVYETGRQMNIYQDINSIPLGNSYRVVLDPNFWSKFYFQIWKPLPPDLENPDIIFPESTPHPYFASYQKIAEDLSVDIRLGMDRLYTSYRPLFQKTSNLFFNQIPPLRHIYSYTVPARGYIDRAERRIPNVLNINIWFFYFWKYLDSLNITHLVNYLQRHINLTPAGFLLLQNLFILLKFNLDYYLHEISYLANDLYRDSPSAERGDTFKNYIPLSTHEKINGVEIRTLFAVTYIHHRHLLPTFHDLFEYIDIFLDKIPFEKINSYLNLHLVGVSLTEELTIRQTARRFYQSIFSHFFQISEFFFGKKYRKVDYPLMDTYVAYFLRGDPYPLWTEDESQIPLTDILPQMEFIFLVEELHISSLQKFYHSLLEETTDPTLLNLFRIIDKWRVSRKTILTLDNLDRYYGKPYLQTEYPSRFYGMINTPLLPPLPYPPSTPYGIPPAFYDHNLDISTEEFTVSYEHADEKFYEKLEEVPRDFYYLDHRLLTEEDSSESSFWNLLQRILQHLENRKNYPICDQWLQILFPKLLQNLDLPSDEIPNILQDYWCHFQQTERDIGPVKDAIQTLLRREVFENYYLIREKNKEIISLVQHLDRVPLLTLLRKLKNNFMLEYDFYHKYRDQIFHPEIFLTYKERDPPIGMDPIPYWISLSLEEIERTYHPHFLLSSEINFQISLIQFFEKIPFDFSPYRELFRQKRLLWQSIREDLTPLRTDEILSKAENLDYNSFKQFLERKITPLQEDELDYFFLQRMFPNVTAGTTFSQYFSQLLPEYSVYFSLLDSSYYPLIGRKIVTLSFPLEETMPIQKYFTILQEKGSRENLIPFREKLIEILSRGKARCAWIRKLAHYLVESVTVKANGQILDKHDSDWWEIFYQTNLPVGQKRGYQKMIGHLEKWITFNHHQKEAGTIILPLIFYFNRFLSKALPLCASDQTHYELIIKLRERDAVCYRDYLAEYREIPQIQKVCLEVEYFYLSEEERKKFKTTFLEYLTEEVQISLHQPTYRTASNGDKETSLYLRLSQSTKLLFLLSRPTLHTTPSLRKDFRSYYPGECQWDNYGLLPRYRMDNLSREKRNRYLRESRLDPFLENLIRWDEKLQALPYIKIYDANILQLLLKDICDYLGVSFSIEFFYPLNATELYHMIQKHVQISEEIYQKFYGKYHLSQMRYILFSHPLFFGRHPLTLPLFPFLQENPVLREISSLLRLYPEKSQTRQVYQKGTPYREALKFYEGKDLIFHYRHQLVIGEEISKRPDPSYDEPILHPEVNPLRGGYLTFNAERVMAPDICPFWNLIPSYLYLKNYPDIGINFRSWAFHPYDEQPSGSVNLSVIKQVGAELRYHPEIDGDYPPEIKIITLCYNLVRYLSGVCAKVWY